MYTGNRNCKIARELTKLEPKEMFIDFSIFRDQIDEIDTGFFHFKDMEQKITQHPIGPDNTKITEVRAE